LIKDSATEAALQSSNDFGQVQLLRLHETLFAQTMVRVCIDPMMPGAQRDRGEVRALLPQSSVAEDVRMGGFDNGRRIADSRTDYTSELGVVCQLQNTSHCKDARCDALRNEANYRVMFYVSMT
jgi:hypothetical protein